jgi:ABC-type Fe3+/spermidine/putrescine transport system ATPase subunit
MKLYSKEFSKSKHKHLTLLGMSGVGKTHQTNMVALGGVTAQPIEFKPSHKTSRLS